MINQIGQIILVVLIFLNMQSCNKNNDIVSSLSFTEIVPLKIGNSWTTINTEYDTLGNVKTVDTVTVTVLRDTIISSIRWFITDEGIFRNDVNGLWEYWYSTPIITFKYPTVISDTIKISNYITVTEETNISKTTALGQKNCNHYLRTTIFDKNAVWHFYCSPGIGMVLNEAKQKSGENERLLNRIELIRYSLQ